MNGLGSTTATGSHQIPDDRGPDPDPSPPSARGRFWVFESRPSPFRPPQDSISLLTPSSPMSGPTFVYRGPLGWGTAEVCGLPLQG